LDKGFNGFLLIENPAPDLYTGQLTPFTPSFQSIFMHPEMFGSLSVGNYVFVNGLAFGIIAFILRHTKCSEDIVLNASYLRFIKFI